MRSDAAAALLAAVALLLAPLATPAAESEAASAPVQGQVDREPVGRERVTRDQVTREIETLRRDPNLSGQRKERTLRFKDSADVKKADSPIDTSAWAWLRDFARWLTEAARVAVWLVAAVLVALFLVGVRHWVRVRAGAVKGTSAGPLPSHVRDLDIRPESLPARLGEAAAALWQKGEHRAALSLLYRGALSRLVHEHQVPIRAASTEGECLALAARRLAPEPSAFFGRLVQAWQLAVYGARLPDDASVMALCREFDAQLRRAAGAPA